MARGDVAFPRDPATCTSHQTSNTILVVSPIIYSYSSTMGNCCGKPSDENFAGEGRTVASTPKTASKNTKTTSKVPQGGRTLGLSSEGSASSPREAAAKAAEVRTHEVNMELMKSKSRKPEPGRMVATVWI